VKARLPAVCSIIWDDLCMQGRERADRQLMDAQALVGRLVPAGSMFAFLAAHRGPAGGRNAATDAMSAALSKIRTHPAS